MSNPQDIVKKYTRTYTSYSGADIVATCNILGETVTFGTLQTLSYSIHMERAPIRSIGNINAKDYTQGPRTIAGSLVFAVFDKHLIYHMLEDYKNNKKDVITQDSGVFYNILEYSSFKQNTNRHIIADELPPFDITISFANEYGAKSIFALYGVRLVNEGQVMSINDVYTENTYQFVAVDIDYMNTTENIELNNRIDRTSYDNSINSNSYDNIAIGTTVADQPRFSISHEINPGNSINSKAVVNLKIFKTDNNGKNIAFDENDLISFSKDNSDAKSIFEYISKKESIDDGIAIIQIEREHNTSLFVNIIDSNDENNNNNYSKTISIGDSKSNIFKPFVHCVYKCTAEMYKLYITCLCGDTLCCQFDNGDIERYGLHNCRIVEIKIDSVDIDRSLSIWTEATNEFISDKINIIVSNLSTINDIADEIKNKFEITNEEFNNWNTKKYMYSITNCVQQLLSNYTYTHEAARLENNYYTQLFEEVFNMEKLQSYRQYSTDHIFSLCKSIKNSSYITHQGSKCSHSDNEAKKVICLQRNVAYNENTQEFAIQPQCVSIF